MSCLKWRHLKLSISDRSLAKRQSLPRELIFCDKTWFIADVNFDVKAKRLDIKIDFPKGTTFPFEQEGVVNEYKGFVAKIFLDQEQSYFGRVYAASP